MQVSLTYRATVGIPCSAVSRNNFCSSLCPRVRMSETLEGVVHCDLENLGTDTIIHVLAFY